MTRFQKVIRFLARMVLFVGGYFSDWVIGYGLYGFAFWLFRHYMDGVHTLALSMLILTPISAV